MTDSFSDGFIAGMIVSGIICGIMSILILYDFMAAISYRHRKSLNAMKTEKDLNEQISVLIEEKVKLKHEIKELKKKNPTDPMKEL